MSLLWLDGFECYGDTIGSDCAPSGILGRYYSSYYSGIEVGLGRLGTGHCLQGDYNGGQTFIKTKALNNSADTYIVAGVAFKSEEPESQNLFAFYDQNNYENCQLRVSNSGRLILRRYSSTVVATVPNINLLPNIWYYIEIKLTISDTSEVEIRVNGETVLTADSVDTKYKSAATHIEYIVINFTTDRDFYLDDFYVASIDSTGVSDFLGPISITAIHPNSDTATIDWSPSAGSVHYAMVDDTESDDDTTYVYSSTTSSYDIYEYGNLTSSETVHGIAVKTESYDDAAASTNMNIVISGTIISDGDTYTVSDEYSGYVRCSDLNPDTSTQWTYETVNTANFGVKLG